MLEMRNVLNTKLNKKGFTLAELLVVVAIIAILVAVSIPIFTGKLNEAKESTDLANERAAKAAATVAYIEKDIDTTQDFSKYYDAKEGVLQDNKPAGYGKYKNNKDKVLRVTISANSSKVVLKWE